MKIHISEPKVFPEEEKVWQFYVFHISWKINIPGYMCSNFENTIESIFSEHKWRFFFLKTIFQVVNKTIDRSMLKISNYKHVNFIT